MKRVLIPYFNAGFGHISFARAIEAEFKRRRPDWEVRLMDVGAELPGERLTDLYVRSWLKILAQPNWVKTILFKLNSVVPWAFKIASRRAMSEALPHVLQFLDGYHPDLVLPTHWGCGHVFDHARSASGLTYPIYYVFSEFARAYPQIKCGADMYFCLSEEALASLMHIGIARKNIRVISLVVQDELLGDLPDRTESRRSLGLTEDLFTVLFSLGGEGLGRAFPFLDHYYARGKNAQILVLTGKNTDLLESLHRRYPSREGYAKIVPVGFLPDLRTAFAATDVLSGKCGTSFAMESIKTRKPLLVNSLGAPNEADNRDYMVKRGFAVYTPRPADLTARIETLASDEKLYQQTLQPFRSVTDRNGSADIVDFVLEQLKDQE